MGNRICKIVKPKDPGTHLVLDQRDWTYTYYTHDASGNVMAVYDRDLSDNGSDMDDKITLKEQDLYASSRVGLKRPLNDDGSAIVVSGFTFTPGTPGSDGIIPVSATVGSIASSSLPSGMRWITRKQYELSNHLGNVYAVVSDKKIGNANSLSTTAVAYYTADVISATDYFAFGAPENGREFSSTDYRYGFNGKENDPQTVGTGEGTQDYGMRIYNPGLGRFLSVDPLTSEYPWYTPYQFAGNMVINSKDIDGGEPKGCYKDWVKNPNFTDLGYPWEGRPDAHKMLYQGYIISTVVHSNEKYSYYFRQNSHWVQFFPDDSWVPEPTSVNENNVFSTEGLIAGTPSKNADRDLAIAAVCAAAIPVTAMFICEVIAVTSAATATATGVTTTVSSSTLATGTAVGTMGAVAGYNAITSSTESAQIQSVSIVLEETALAPPITFAETTSSEAGSFIVTEEGAQSSSKLNSIANDLQSNSAEYVWSEPVKVTNFNGNMYILDGHNRIQAAYNTNYQGSIPIQVLSEEEASRQYPSEYQGIRSGQFTTTVQQNGQQ